MNQQYARNLHNLAQASKDYTDNKTSELYDILSEFESYKVKESDITITGTSGDYHIVTLSNELETAVLSGKRALFVNGTLMSVLTDGAITTDTLFNSISYDKLTQIQTGMKHVILFSTYTENPFGGIVTFNLGLIQDDNDQWYARYLEGGIDTEAIQMDLGSLQTAVDGLDQRVQTLENAGGSELYQHTFYFQVAGVDYSLTLILKYANSLTRQDLCNILYYNGFTSQNKFYHNPKYGTSDYTNWINIAGLYATGSTSLFARYWSNASQLWVNEIIYGVNDDVIPCQS